MNGETDGMVERVGARRSLVRRGLGVVGLVCLLTLGAQSAPASAGTIDVNARCYVDGWGSYTGKTLPNSKVFCTSLNRNNFWIDGRSTNGVGVTLRVLNVEKHEFCYRYWSKAQGCQRY